MRTTRREWLSRAGLGALWFHDLSRLAAAQSTPSSEVTRRIATAIREYESQGFHRTATDVDRVSGDWLADHVRQAGLRGALEPFPVNRVDLVASTLSIAGRQIDGIPLFDGAFTPAAGVAGRLGAVGSTAAIGLTETAVNQAHAGSLGEARRANRHQAIVAISKGRRPGLCPSNADSFLTPFGPPVLQVSSEEQGWLSEHAAKGTDVRLVAHVTRTAATANNVTAELTGSDPTLAPIVIMTPRSGWYRCASERGGGIACWLEIMRALQTARLKRTVMFVASSGHELGHLGIDVYIERRAGIVKRAAGWLHLGANIGAATDLTANLLQASDDQMETAMSGAMQSSGLAIGRRAPRGRVPAGEAENVHKGGGRYVSAIGGSLLFHHLDDHGPGASDPVTIAKFSSAFVAVARGLDG